jgi:hypothetical protein
MLESICMHGAKLLNETRRCAVPVNPTDCQRMRNLCTSLADDIPPKLKKTVHIYVLCDEYGR